ncbi:cytochrome c class I [Siminovitchia terrae]|uniref:Cytochrome c class I n=1 Tax=Siminovitchia terrae TaxID=1914933 RepID=A0A429XAC8_SIMTE|nr:cytochrome c class I [Siminovitchia terrae]RST60311.1 cytochrome c class I [Siminovitchia terrae]
MLQLFSIIPKDIELAIPGNIGFFEVLIVVSFLMHILFVNITVGSSTLAVFQEVRGMRKKEKVFDEFAFQLANHTSILKSIAVVLGVAPLLLISVIYTQYFYPSTLLIGKAWLSLLIILITAFLILYAYKFLWRKMDKGGKKVLHVAIGASGSLLLLFVPLIFIVNVVSMLYPEMWAGSKGFFHGLFYYPQIWQRYFHFILASFAVTGIYLYFWNNRLQKKLNTQSMENNKKQEKFIVYVHGKRLGLQVAIWTTLLQLIFGTILLISFERPIMMLYMGEDLLLTTLLLVSILLTLVMVFFLYQLQKHDVKRYLMLSLTTFLVVLSLMGWMRHELRENYLQPYIDQNPRTANDIESN